MQEHFVKSTSKSHATYCQTLPFCGYTRVITEVIHLWSRSSLIFLHLTKWKQKLLPRFVKWLSLVSITTSKEILLLQMDPEMERVFVPSFLKSHVHTYRATGVLSWWFSQHWNPTCYKGLLRTADLARTFWDGSSKWKVSTSHFPLNLAPNLAYSEIQSKLEYTVSHLNVTFVGTDKIICYKNIWHSDKKNPPHNSALTSIITHATAKHLYITILSRSFLVPMLQKCFCVAFAVYNWSFSIYSRS